jgi:hypothetical protein
MTPLVDSLYIHARCCAKKCDCCALYSEAAVRRATVALLKIMAMTKLKAGIIAGILVAAIATTAVMVKTHPPISLPPLPNPNGYQYFVQAARKLPAGVSNYNQMSPAALRTLVGQDAAALALARQGFQYECRVADNFATNLTDTFKSLNYAFVAEGRLAELEQRAGDAVRSYLDNLRFGQESSRGGTIMVRLLGIGIESLAVKSLWPMTNTADANRCKEIALALESLDAKEPSISETMQQEKAWADKNWSLRDLIPGTRAMQNKMLAPVLQWAVGKFQTNQLTLRQTMITFAARAYEMDRKQPPKSVGDLVPVYLKSIPQDPRTGNLMTNLR